MKIKLFFLLALMITMGCNDRITDTDKQPNTMETEISTKKLRHVVLFKFKESATAEDIENIEKVFSELPSKIPTIVDFEMGINNSPEGLNKGLTHCFLLTFESEKDRDDYLPHPAHKAFGAVLQPHLEDVLVVDYWSEWRYYLIP